VSREVRRGFVSHTLSRGKVLARLAAVCLGTSALAVPAMAGVIDYPDGSNNTSPIVLTDNTTQLQVLTGSATQSGIISESGGSFGLEKIGSGTLFLTAANTYTGGTTVSAGTLRLGTGGSLTSTGALTLNGGTFDLNGNNATIGTLSGTFSTLAIGSGNLTINQAGTSPYYGTITGTGGLIFNGPGTLALNGQDNHTGSITVNGGSLTVMTGSGVSDLTINGGSFGALSKTLGFGTLSGTGGTLNLGGSFMTFTSNTNSTFAGVITDSAQGQFTKAGSGTLILTGASTAISDLVISQGTLQFGNGGTSGGFPARSITDNATLVFDRSDNVTYTGNISGTGTLVQSGTGTLHIRLLNFTPGSTVINAGTLDIDSVSSVSGNIVNNSALIFEPNSVLTYGGVISGNGTVTVGSGGTLILTGTNSYTGETTIGAVTLQLGNGGASGSVAGNVADNGALVFDRSDATTFLGAISGTGSVSQSGSGTVILSGANSYTGGTTVSSGTLRLGGSGGLASIGALAVNGGTFDLNGNSQTVGALSGTGGTITLGSGNLTTSSGATTNLASTISGSGSLTKMGSGTLTLSGTNTYTGATNVNAGVLNVTGSIASSSVSVASGATLNGTGRVGPTSVASGGTLAPGAGTTPGTLAIAGNLVLASGSSFSDAFTPSAAGLASVDGTASISGNALANFSSGSYAFGQRYTLISASGGLSGTFSSLATTGLPVSLRANLSYDAKDAYLTVNPGALGPSLGGNTTSNQHNVVAAIDAAVAGGLVPANGFTALYGLSGSALNSAIDQISGQIGPNVSNAVGQSFLSFLAVTADGGAGSAESYAPGSAYDVVTAPHRAQLGAGKMRVWGGAYGGHVGLSADAASGAAGVSASNVGLIGGADMQLGDGILAGVTLDWGRQHFGSGNGSGTSTDYAFGIYGRADMDAAYITAAFGYGWHQIATLRVVTVSGTDVLQGKENADDFGGRIEAGWRLPLGDGINVAPYAAFAGESFESPAYAETVLAGASTFALSYAAQNTTLGRSELGAHLNRGFGVENGALSADLKAAWAHQLDDQPFALANFENLATASFQVLGVRPARDSALLGAGLELRYHSGLYLGLKGEGQFGAGTTVLESMGSVGLRW